MRTTTYTVTGMTCGHCVRAVSAELGKLAGVIEVNVDLPTDQVQVISDEPLDEDAARAAVEEAGYELAP